MGRVLAVGSLSPPPFSYIGREASPPLGGAPYVPGMYHTPPPGCTDWISAQHRAPLPNGHDG